MMLGSGVGKLNVEFLHAALKNVQWVAGGCRIFKLETVAPERVRVAFF